jgi:hypothetical protein
MAIESQKWLIVVFGFMMAQFHYNKFCWLHNIIEKIKVSMSMALCDWQQQEGKKIENREI